MNITEFIFGFNGRVNRSKWWLMSVINIGVTFAYSIIYFMLVISMNGTYQSYSATNSIVSLLFLLLFLFQMFFYVTVSVKRLHDINKNGLWVLVFWLSPFILFIISFLFYMDGTKALFIIFGLASLGVGVWGVVELGCLPGTAGPNLYGAAPQDFSVSGSGHATPTFRPSQMQKPPVVVHNQVEFTGDGQFSEYFLGVTAAELLEMPNGCVIGRDASCATFVIQDDRISRAHARLQYDNANFTITDLGSSNGTDLNGRRLVSHSGFNLNDGDHVKFGPATFRVKVI